MRPSTEWAVSVGPSQLQHGQLHQFASRRPADFRGKVYALQAGQCVTHDRDLGPGWKHLAAVRRDGRLELFVDGRKTAESPAPSGSPLDVTNGQPLRLAAGETDSFSGRIHEVRMYRRALAGETLRRLAEQR